MTNERCVECGHKHAGPELARICIGCPCPLFVGAATTRMVGIDPEEWQRRVAAAHAKPTPADATASEPPSAPEPKRERLSLERIEIVRAWLRADDGHTMKRRMLRLLDEHAELERRARELCERLDVLCLEVEPVRWRRGAKAASIAVVLASKALVELLDTGAKS